VLATVLFDRPLDPGDEEVMALLAEFRRAVQASMEINAP
jgi:hypothetical protein